MKKIGALLCVLFMTVCLSACSAFHDDTTKNYQQDNPLETTVFLQVKNVTADPAAELANWLAAVRAANHAITDETATKITAIEPRDDSTVTDTYTFDLTIQNVPDSVLRKQIRPFKITYTQTIFNPITLLPDSDVFNYIVAYSTQRRHSAVNTEQVTTAEDGSYVYLWSTKDAIEFVDYYPNRPLYYVIIIAGAAVIGTCIYLVSRYYDCKKRQKPL